MRSLRNHLHFGTLVAFTALLTACSAGDGEGSGGDNSDAGDVGLIPTGGDGDFEFDVPTGDGEGRPVVDDDRDLPVREKICDANGENCTCLRMALLGTLDSAANDKDSGPFVDWLNDNSGGTATVDMITTKPFLDQNFLANYDILITANVNGWDFTQAERDAVAEWSLTTGGGVVSLTGFISKNSEESFTSQLIEFSGIEYTSIFTAEQGQEVPVTYEGEVVQKHCLGTGAIITTPIAFSPLEGSLDKLTFELDYTGAFVGYGIHAPEDATVVALDPTSDQPIAVAKEVNDAGRVFAWGDEWVIFANQWESDPPQQDLDPNNPCYKEAEGTQGEDGYVPAEWHTVSSLYQTKQFWYNVINWVAPPNECGFVIEDEDVVVRVR